MQNKPLFDTKRLLEIAEHGFVEGGPKLPSPPMLMFDRVTVLEQSSGRYGKGYVEAELDVKPDAWFFKCHFVGDPVMPGCLGLDALWQLVGFYMGKTGKAAKGRALGCGAVTFKGEVNPSNKKVQYKVHIERVLDRLKQSIIYADGEMWCDGEKIYDAKKLKVGFFS